MTRILFIDVDGTLTDGGILLGATEDIRRFHAHDGVGIRLATLAGIEVIFLSARECVAAERRAKELGVRSMLGAARKDEHILKVCAEAGITAAEAAMIGDDLQDLPGLRVVGRPIAVGNAVPEIRSVCSYVTRAHGGNGAVREAIEWILREENRWDDTLATFVSRSDFVIRKPGEPGAV